MKRKEEGAVSDDRPQENSVPEQPTAQQEPDVLLNVENLEVDRISLEVDGLRAHVSLLAELANLLHLSVGADVRLDAVKLEIEGVEAQATLKVRLEHVRAILEKALDTIAEHPQILDSLARSVDQTAEEVGGATEEAVGEGQVTGQGRQAAQGASTERGQSHALRRAPGPGVGGGSLRGARHGSRRPHHRQRRAWRRTGRMTAGDMVCSIWGAGMKVRDMGGGRR
jgi:hypothetical protein